MTEEEVTKLEEQTETVELELEGEIYLVQKDKNGNVLLKETLNKELILKALVSIFDEAVKVYNPTDSDLT